MHTFFCIHKSGRASHRVKLNSVQKGMEFHPRRKGSQGDHITKRMKTSPLSNRLKKPSGGCLPHQKKKALRRRRGTSKKVGEEEEGGRQQKRGPFHLRALNPVCASFLLSFPSPSLKGDLICQCDLAAAAAAATATATAARRKKGSQVTFFSLLLHLRGRERRKGGGGEAKDDSIWRGGGNVRRQGASLAQP